MPHALPLGEGWERVGRLSLARWEGVGKGLGSFWRLGIRLGRLFTPKGKGLGFAPKPLRLLVAGAGFEPTTFGL